jgi:hypothetical protein
MIGRDEAITSPPPLSHPVQVCLLCITPIGRAHSHPVHEHLVSLPARRHKIVNSTKHKLPAGLVGNNRAHLHCLSRGRRPCMSHVLHYSSRMPTRSHGYTELRPIQPSPSAWPPTQLPGMRPLMNYHILASLISLQPDFAIFRRFLEANARDLLRLQGEITHLESDLQSIISADRASGDPERAEFEFCIASLKGPPHPSRESEPAMAKADRTRPEARDL